MEDQAIGIFIHVAGGIGMFIALGLEWAGLWQLRYAVLPEHAKVMMGIFKGAARVGLISMLVNVIVALYMIWIEGSLVAWITLSFAALILVIALNMFVTRPRMAVMGHTLATEKGPLSKIFHNQANQPLLWISLQTRVTVLLGLTFLMIAKPGLVISLVTLGISILIGFASAFPFFRGERAHEGFAS